MKNVLWIALIICSIASSAAAECVSGRVENHLGMPISGCTVSLALVWPGQVDIYVGSVVLATANSSGNYYAGWSDEVFPPITVPVLVQAEYPHGVYGHEVFNGFPC